MGLPPHATGNQLEGWRSKDPGVAAVEHASAIVLRTQKGQGTGNVADRHSCRYMPRLCEPVALRDGPIRPY